jgi:hypothetical protein
MVNLLASMLWNLRPATDMAIEHNETPAAGAQVMTEQDSDSTT